ncbi:ArsA family ATPase [Candidatus Bathyarchaeota archaeon]|nr:ArsA family ATPase [Candidatus Bathyarchaeota archaeon]MBS7627956.1 ArsA family ATPase [Candidatus Bathyarchaeota archaeon]
MLRDLIIPKGETRYIFFGGKGGVGKSSIAAATSTWLANKGFKTLLVSTDLQKSQNDIFGQEFGSEEETRVEGLDNLMVINVDAKESIRKHQIEVLKKIDSIRGADWEIRFLKEYWEKNPVLPCETASYNVFVHYLNSREYDAIVFDTAPGGHNFEMISYPWRHLDRLRKSILAKREVVDLTGRVAEIELLEKMGEDNLRAIEALSSESTVYILVLHPELLPVYETKRIQESLRPYGISIRGIVLNQILPKEFCTNAFFKARRALQEKYIAIVRSEFPEIEIGELPLLETEVVGLENVKRLSELLYG